jgi:hypothetical protein
VFCITLLDHHVVSPQCAHVIASLRLHFLLNVPRILVLQGSKAAEGVLIRMAVRLEQIDKVVKVMQPLAYAGVASS